MSITLGGAAAAYQRAALTSAQKPAAPEQTKQSFGEAMTQATEKAVGQIQQAEKTTAAAVTGQAGVLDVVTAANEAEMTLKTMVTVRDKVIQAYQDIIRMPI